MLRPSFSKPIRIFAIFVFSALTAGCFQPLYGDRGLTESTSIRDKLGSVEVPQINVPKGTRLSRVSGEVRNELLFQLTGGGASQTINYRLDMIMSSSNLSVIVDIATGRPDQQIYTIGVSYVLTEVGTNQKVITGKTFAQVSFDIPGQQQRFASERALRDAENRAAKVVADNLLNRLASYFTAGT